MQNKGVLCALGSNLFKSKSILNCWLALKKLSDGNFINVTGIADSKLTEGMLIATSLAIKILESSNQRKVSEIYDSIRTYYQRIDRIITKDVENKWINSSKNMCSKLFFQGYDKLKTKILLQESKSGLCNLICIISGHNLLGKHAKRLKLAEDDNCHFCFGLDCSEDIQHSMQCQCEALLDVRMTFRFILF